MEQPHQQPTRMAQPSESQSQPPLEASLLDKLHHLHDEHHQQNGHQPPPTDGTRATTSGGGSNDNSNTTTTTTAYTSTGSSGITTTTTTTTANIEASGQGARSDRQPSETSLAVESGITPHEAAQPEDPASSHHNGENGTRNSSDARSPPSPSMSDAHHPPGPHRQQVGYPSPTSFPSPGMPPSAQYAYAPQPGPHVDPYRASPTAVNTPMSLPSMRTIDPHQQQQQAHSMGMGAAMGAPMGAGAAQIYYNMPPHAYGMHHDPNALRYALPPNMADPRIALSGGRHKKEIKRRTKTGCLTCRKRRIKCDETHPTCNNCKKSKRECLGYDPIFKQQPGPAAIQPAPNSQGASPTTLVSPPTVPSSTTHPFQPPIVPSSYPPTAQPNSAFEPSLQPSAKTVKTEGGFEYPAAIDPALGGVDLSAAGNPAHYQSAQKFAQGASLGDQKLGSLTGLRGGTPFPVDPLQSLWHFSNHHHPQEITLTYAGLPAKKMKIDELVALGGAPPPSPSPPATAETVEEIIRLYFEVYVPGLTMFFESSWYDLKKDQPEAVNPLAILRENSSVVNLFTSFLRTISNIKTTNPAHMIYSGHLESCLVWALARLPFASLSSSSRQTTGPFPAEDDVTELCNRLFVFETLLSGETLQTNPLTPPPASSEHKDFNQVRANELDFWYHLGQYVLQAHGPASPTGASVREHCLARIRSVLDGRENRDVLYSIAVLRQYAPQFDATLNEQTVPAHLDEMDPRSKLAVATRFIRDEAASTGGTTNVVRRFADLAYRAFVRPGVNVNGHVRG